MKRLTTFLALGVLAFNTFSITLAQGGEITPSCITPPSGIVGWWPGEGNANDIIGLNNGTLSGSGVTFVSGMVGQGIRLDGTNGYVQIPDSPALKPANVTVEAWVWLDPAHPTNQGGEQIVFKKNTWPAWFEGYSLLKETIDNGDGTYSDHFQFVVSRDGDQVVINSQTIVQRGVWYHVAATYDGNQSVLYVNGVAEASAVAGFALDYDTTPVYIGTTGTWAPYLNMFGGIIDEASIYNRALSADEIQSIHNAGSAGKCQLPFTPSNIPKIFSFTPDSGTNGTPVTIVGTNFNATAASNIVYFGATRATVSSASPITLEVKVPVGATYAPISVTTGGLTAYSATPFMPTFTGTGSGINATNFGVRQDLPTLNGPNQTVIADIDGDGKPDLIVADDYNNSISIYRNISTGGTLTTNSFAPAVILPTTSGTYSPYGLVVADLDGDGKLDIIVTEYGDNLVSVYKNNCTPGNITTNSFGLRMDFPTGSQPQRIAVADLDRDGRPDVVVANTGDGTVSILQNISVDGSIIFAPKVDFAAGSSCDAVATGDLNGDGKPDIAAVNTDGTLSVLQNVINAPGTITTNSFAPQISLPIPSGGVDVAIVDIDGDGRLDLAVTTYLPQLFSVIQNLSNGGDLTANSFGQRIDYPLDGRGHTISVGDLDGDGRPDLVVDTELNSTISIFHNESTPGILTNNSLSGPIELATGWNAWGSSVGDLDGDSRPEIVFANTYDNTISIYQNLMPFGMAAPFVLTQPASQVVIEGRSASFCVTVGGSAPFSYQWKFNNVKIPGATNAMLTLTNIHPYQAGNYSVVVNNAYGMAVSSNAVLMVISQAELIYNYSGSEKITTAGSESTYNYSGEMFFIPANTNGVFVGWATMKGRKQYWVQPFADYLMISIPGAGHTYTVLGKAGEGIDDNGHPQIWSYLHKGQNANLNIGNRRTISFPDDFFFQSTDIHTDPNSGNTEMQEASSIYTYSYSATQSANNNGQTLDDLVNALVATLRRQGYQPF